MFFFIANFGHCLSATRPCYILYARDVDGLFSATMSLETIPFGKSHRLVILDTQGAGPEMTDSLEDDWCRSRFSWFQLFCWFRILFNEKHDFFWGPRDVTTFIKWNVIFKASSCKKHTCYVWHPQILSPFTNFTMRWSMFTHWHWNYYIGLMLETCGKLNVPMFLIYHPKRFAESYPNLEKSMPDLHKRPTLFAQLVDLFSGSFWFKAWTWHTLPLWFLYVLCFFWSPHFAPATMTLWLSVSVGSQLGLGRRISCVFAAQNLRCLSFFRWLSLEKWGQAPIPFT